MKYVRPILAILSSGPAFYGFFRLCFIASGAQQILGNPAYQSSKFLKVFLEYPPLPRMVDPVVLWEGFFVAGVCLALAFMMLNRSWQGAWWKRGLRFGLIHWLIMVPWFEFYLPYNVMNEPMALVLLESGIWMAVALLTGMWMSFCLNFRGRPVS